MNYNQMVAFVQALVTHTNDRVQAKSEMDGLIYIDFRYPHDKHSVLIDSVTLSLEEKIRKPGQWQLLVEKSTGLPTRGALPQLEASSRALDFMKKVLTGLDCVEH